jgi:hypothetical protein
VEIPLISLRKILAIYPNECGRHSALGGAGASTDPTEEARRIAASIDKLPAFMRPSINVKHKIDLHLPHSVRCLTSCAAKSREHAAILLSPVRS